MAMHQQRFMTLAGPALAGFAALAVTIPGAGAVGDTSPYRGADIASLDICGSEPQQSAEPRASKLRVVAAELVTMAAAADFAPPKTDAEKISNAAAAAPAAIGNDAAVVEIDPKGNMRTLREGTNSWVCNPDLPWTPTNDPQCQDANGWAWVQAFVKQERPVPGKVGFAYMLQGGSDGSNTDPMAMEPPSGHDWLIAPPHVMIFNMPERPQGYPSPVERPDTTRPWIMWAGTPYEHLMIPIE
jgi:hypothetical protein